MKPSELRVYVMKIFEDEQPHDQNEIKKKVDEHFGGNIYTDVQLHNLIYNLLRAEDIIRTDNKKFIISKVRTASSKEIYTLNQYVQPIKEWCMEVKKSIDKPGYLSRYSKEQREEIELVYDLNQKIITIIDKYKTKMK